MVTIAGVLTSMAEILKALVPAGIEPINFWLIFLVTFAISFIALLLIPIFKNARGIVFIIAIVIAYFVASSAVATIIISKLFPNIGLALMAILGLLLVIAVLSPKSLEKGTSWTPLIVIIVITFIIYMTYTSVVPQLQAAGYISKSTGVTITDDDVATIIAAIVVIGLIYMIVRSKPTEESVFDKILKYLKGKSW
ncbi:MAG: hypothetical protein J7K22_02580 [Nanoarchaeota archaeon]|nr:hypothetical protein [Nanoarchaeota archaeon]